MFALHLQNTITINTIMFLEMCTLMTASSQCFTFTGHYKKSRPVGGDLDEMVRKERAGELTT